MATTSKIGTLNRYWNSLTCISSIVVFVCCVNRFVECVMWKIEKKNKKLTNRCCCYNNTPFGPVYNEQPTYNNYSLESIVCSLQFSCCHHHHHHSKRFKQHKAKHDCIHSFRVKRAPISHRSSSIVSVRVRVSFRFRERPIATIPRFQHNFPLKIIRHRWAGNRNKSDSVFSSPFTFMVVHTTTAKSI